MHQLPSFCALCFAIFPDEVVLLIFVLQTFSWNHSPIYLFAPLFCLKHFEASALLCVVKGILLDIGLNLWHSLVLQAQISNFPHSLKRSVSYVKLFSLKKFILSLNEAPKAHYFCFLLLIQRSAVQQNQTKLLCQTPKAFSTVKLQFDVQSLCLLLHKNFSTSVITAEKVRIICGRYQITIPRHLRV